MRASKQNLKQDLCTTTQKRPLINYKIYSFFYLRLLDLKISLKF